jgi:hypothetical protein
MRTSFQHRKLELELKGEKALAYLASNGEACEIWLDPISAVYHRTR